MFDRCRAFAQGAGRSRKRRIGSANAAGADDSAGIEFVAPLRIVGNVGCADSPLTESHVPWFAGTWDAISIDGNAMPATFVGAASIGIRYESMRLTIAPGPENTNFAFAYSTVAPNGAVTTLTSCWGQTSR